MEEKTKNYADSRGPDHKLRRTKPIKLTPEQQKRNEVRFAEIEAEKIALFLDTRRLQKEFINEKQNGRVGREDNKNASEPEIPTED